MDWSGRLDGNVIDWKYREWENVVSGGCVKEIDGCAAIYILWLRHRHWSH